MTGRWSGFWCWVVLVGSVCGTVSMAWSSDIGTLANATAGTIQGYVLEIAPVVLGVFAIIIGVAVIISAFKFFLSRF